MRLWIVIATLTVGLAAAPPGAAVEPVTYAEIVETIRELAADHLGVKAAEVDTVSSLFSQGMNEKSFDALVVEIQQEFGVVLDSNDVRRAKWNDNARALSVRRLADMVSHRQQSPSP
jgi:acyl carrier protein